MALSESELRSIRAELKSAVLEAVSLVDTRHRAERAEAEKVHIINCPVSRRLDVFQANQKGIFATLSFLCGLAGWIVANFGKLIWERIINGGGQ